MNRPWQYTSNILMGAVKSESASDGGNGPTDQILVQQAQSGDYSAFDQLVTRHRGKVYAMIVNMIQNDADAWDLAQDSFIKAWKALPKFEHRAQFTTWLFRISHNVVYDWMRKKKIKSDGDLDDAMLMETQIDNTAPTAPSLPIQPDQHLNQKDLRIEIEKALAQLSPEHREIILLREVNGMDYSEIATIVQCSKGTVMSRLFYARKKLQTLLKS